VLAQEVEMVADQGEAVDIAMGHDLERAIALPKAAIRAESLDDAADQGGEVEVRGCLLAESVERADLDTDVLVPGQGAEGIHIGAADRPVDPNSTEMVDDDGRLGKPATHPIDLGEAVGVDQTAQGLTGLGCCGKQRLVTGRLEPA